MTADKTVTPYCKVERNKLFVYDYNYLNIKCKHIIPIKSENYSGKHGLILA